MALDLERVQALLRLVNESGVAEVEVEEKGTRIVIRRTAATVTVQPAGMHYPMAMMPQPGAMPPSGAPAATPPAAPAAPPEAPAEPGSGANETVVRAPIVGTFYRAPSPDSDPFVKEGDTVGPDSTLCIIEAMKLMNEIKAEASGRITKILVENAQPVEYDQPLFVLEA